MNLNKVYLIGRVASDIEVKNTPSGASVCTFNLATNRSWKDANGQKKEESQFHRIVLWGKLAELAGKFLSKGALVMVEGRLATRNYESKSSGEKRYITEIIGESMQFGPKSSGNTTSREDFNEEKEFSKPAETEGKSRTKKESLDDMEIDIKDIPF